MLKLNLEENITFIFSTHDQRVIDMKKDEFRAKLHCLRKSEGKGFFTDGQLGCEKNGGGLAPTWLENICHRNLLKLRPYVVRLVLGMRCPVAQNRVR